MPLRLRIESFEIILLLSNTIGLADPMLVNHNKQVAYISFFIGQELGLTNKEITDLILAGVLHDIGSFSVKEKKEILEFKSYNMYKHAEKGYKLLRTYSPLLDVANTVRFHHVFWEGGKGDKFKGHDVPLASHIIHLADRISILIDTEKEILSQAHTIYETVLKNSDFMFKPELVAAFNNVRKKESFWLDVTSNNIMTILNNSVDNDMLDLDINALTELSHLFARVIDFRSSFTATHSSGVAACATFLAEQMGFSESECKMMKTAGYLHDLGKLAIPVDILEKENALTTGERNVIKSHTYYTYRTLETIKECRTINIWASLHHERLSGNGYPLHLSDKEIPLGSRIMAVADVFTAITEDRPYRKGMDNSEVINVLDKMVNSLALDAMVVSVLKNNLEAINKIRINAQKSAKEEYNIVNSSIL